MNKKNIRFIAADMDGTLLDEGGQLDPAFFPLYQKLADENIIFCAASGRQYFSLTSLFKPVAENMMFIAENGALVMHQGKEIFSSTMERNSTFDIIRQAKSIENVHVVLCGKKSAYIDTPCPDAMAEIKKYYFECQVVDDLFNVEDEFIKVAILHFEGSEQMIYPTIDSAFGKDYKVVLSSKIWLDVMNTSASKGAAIEHLQKTLGFSYEETMSFGDYFNDVEMLEASYYSYAMENAHPGVKLYARNIAPSNTEGGVIRVIEQYLANIQANN